MSIVARTLIFACLTTALVHLPLPERVGPVEDRARSEAEVVRVPNAPHPATSGVRASLPDALISCLDNAAFAASSAIEPGAACVNVATSAAARTGAGLDAATIQPPSRAPPIYS